MTIRTASLALAFASLPALIAQTAPSSTPPAAKPDKDGSVKLEEFVVTGVFNATEARKATTAITTLSSDFMIEQVPLSADDLLLNVAGVFVNSSLGEIRGMVYSRGVSADSSDGATGTYYVSMQEDGLPFTNVSFGNYGSGYFNRPDGMLNRLEAVRGGSASITSSNSPGGAFNYISRTGPSRFGGEVRTRTGLEGRQSPHLRTDLSFGGPLGKQGWTYAVGGFYRYAEGHRPPDGWPMNNGFDVRGNLSKDYGHGSLKLYGKFLDDRNHWYEYLLARDPANPKQYPGLSRFSTNLHPKTKFQYPRETETQLNTFDTTDAVRSRQRYVGAEWKHEFGDGWSVNHNLRFARNWADWNSSSGVTPRSLDWPNFFSTMSIQFSGGGQNGRIPAGTYRFFDRQNGNIAAEVTSNGNFTVNANALNNAGLVVRFAALPNQQILPNALWTNVGRTANEHINEIMDRLSFTKRLGKMTFTAGGFFGYSGISDRQSSGGRTAAPLVEQPQPLGILWIPATTGNAPAGTPAAALTAIAGFGGKPVLLTNPEGFTALGVGYTRDKAIARQLAYFFGHKWDVNQRLTLDWGFRAESFAVKGFNQAGVQNARGNWDPTYGGADGDIFTMADNRFTAPNPAAKWAFDKSIKSFSWSGAGNFVINNEHSFYVRFADGQKAPDYGFFRNYTSQFRLDNLKPRAQTVLQAELGYRWKTPRVTLTATPFWTQLGHVLAITQATEADGVTPYFPDPIYNAVTSYGLELEGQFRISDRWSLRSVFTKQWSTNTVWKIFVAGANGSQDDSYLDFSGRKSDNNPDFIFNETLSYRTPKFFANLSWRHMGQRAGNAANVIILPRFNQFDFGTGYTINRKWSLTLNVNNVTDTEGVMTWRGWGINPGDRQSYTSLPATGHDTMLQYVPVQPRACFLTTTYRF
ncbi:MAG: TonB-dependent receptor [Verrucomicrobia bacterium]|nr:TonB-dependent receptor [Verrucomicrobiota bacterium]